MEADGKVREDYFPFGSLSAHFYDCWKESSFLLASLLPRRASRKLTHILRVILHANLDSSGLECFQLDNLSRIRSFHSEPLFFEGGGVAGRWCVLNLLGVQRVVLG